MTKTVELTTVEARMTALSRTKKGFKVTFAIHAEDVSVEMQLLPLDEPMTLRLSKMEVGA